MHHYSEYVKKATNDHKMMHEISDIICEHLEFERKFMPDSYHRLMYKIHTAIYGHHFDEELAKRAVAEMVNVDGTTGEHWSMDETNKLADQHHIQYKCDWYYALNMIASDLYKVTSDTNTLVKVTKALYFEDPDMPEGKVFKQWAAVHGLT
ncbi:MAG: hypothetical protein IKW14_02485 [Phascolarctobacterium sp.]|nr:hypothetical protein [Phascolarctobacterium sp.]